MSKAEKFQKELGDQVAKQLGQGFRFYKTALELRRKTDNGHEVIALAGSNKWSPDISLSFYMGKRFNLIVDLEKQLERQPRAYHISQYSPNHRKFKGLNYLGPGTWETNIERSEGDLSERFALGIQNIAYPFFERFKDIEAARDAILSNDTWCFGCKAAFWDSLALFDVATGRTEHFKEWMGSLDSFYLEQAKEFVNRVESLPHRNLPPPNE